MVLKIVLGAVVAAVLGVSGYAAFKEHGLRTLAKSFDEKVNAGDYLAALAAAGTLKEAGKANVELEQKVAAAARLLVAEDAFAKAKQAKEEKRFADAGALLRGSTALSDSSFKYYEEAKKLYAETEARAAGVAHQTAVTISSLENQAQAEKAKRAEAEKQSEQLSGALKVQQAVVTEAGRKLDETRKAADAKQAELLAQVEKESRQKFFTELRTYRDMAEKGRQQLANALAEINAKRDVTALIFVSQGKILFEEAKSKTADLRNNRTPSAYQSRVDDFQNSLTKLLDAAKQFRNAVVYIDDQGSAEFTNSFSKAKTALDSAVSYLSKVTDLIASNP